MRESGGGLAEFAEMAGFHLQDPFPAAGLGQTHGGLPGQGHAKHDQRGGCHHQASRPGGASAKRCRHVPGRPRGPRRTGFAGRKGTGRFLGSGLPIAGPQPRPSAATAPLVHHSRKASETNAPTAVPMSPSARPGTSGGRQIEKIELAGREDRLSVFGNQGHRPHVLLLARVLRARPGSVRKKNCPSRRCERTPPDQGIHHGIGPNWRRFPGPVRTRGRTRPIATPLKQRVQGRVPPRRSSVATA